MFWLLLSLSNALGLLLHARQGDTTGAIFCLVGFVGSTLLFFGAGDD